MEKVEKKNCCALLKWFKILVKKLWSSIQGKTNALLSGCQMKKSLPNQKTMKWSSFLMFSLVWYSSSLHLTLSSLTWTSGLKETLMTLILILPRSWVFLLFLLQSSFIFYFFTATGRKLFLDRFSRSQTQNVFRYGREQAKNLNPPRKRRHFGALIEAMVTNYETKIQEQFNNGCLLVVAIVTLITHEPFY